MFNCIFFHTIIAQYTCCNKNTYRIYHFLHLLLS